MNTCKALIVPADESQPVRVETIGIGLESLQSLVGGNIEVVRGDDWYFYLNEEGKILGLEPNVRAGALFLKLTGDIQDLYCGDVVFLGETPHGYDADVPANVRFTAALIGLGQPTV